MTIIIRRVIRVDLDERSNILGGLFNPPSAESTLRAANTRTLPLFRHHFPFTPFYYFSLYRFHFHLSAWETLSCSHLWQFPPFRTINKSISDHSIHILCMNSQVFFACQRKFSVTKRGLLEARGLFFWRASANLGIPQIVSHHPAFLFS